MRESRPGQPAPSSTDRLYPNVGYNRRVAFVQTNGKKKSFNYAYLVSHDHDPDEGFILLEFTTHTVKVAGFNLERLYFELFDERNRLIICLDERYQALEQDESIVTEITVKKNA